MGEMRLNKYGDVISVLIVRTQVCTFIEDACDTLVVVVLVLILRFIFLGLIF